MEAAVMDREAEMTEWNDGRLDDLSQRVNRVETKMDAGFVEVKRQMDEGFVRVDAKFEALEAKLDKKLDGLQRSLIQIAWTFGVGMLTFAGALLGLLATKV
ncbi:MAG TPA: hypothetical protein VFJ65_05895 [Solirubrobacterales bacterium]|nr:hypothetical protein [Solirubrobacterales bacterium]